VADGLFDLRELEQLLFSLLEAQGNPVSITILPGTNHDSLSREGRDVLLEAIAKAAGRP
jgi:hypothetical protein